MKLIYPILFLILSACQTHPFEQVDKPLECNLFDSIPFERNIPLDDPKLDQFLHPIQTVDSIILTYKIVPETIATKYPRDTLFTETWTFNQQLLKIRERKHDSYYAPEKKGSFLFYKISTSRWYCVKERRRFSNDSLIDKMILNFNDTNYVNCIRAVGPEPIRGFRPKKLKTLPIVNPQQIWRNYYGRLSLIEYTSSH
ncbi:MAG: hypothetical protein ACI8ZM_000137 [Crocinitomix sp.]|jgi:hypothetical protein